MQQLVSLNQAVSDDDRFPRKTAFIVLALSTIAVALISWSAGCPTVMSPGPFLVILPLIMGSPFAAFGVIPVASFCLFLWPITRSRRGPIPTQVTILLGIATVLSAVWIGSGWSYAVEHHGLEYTRGITIINLVFLVSLGTMRLILPGDRPFEWRIAFGTLFFYWLFGFAFPYLGELP